MTPQAAFDAALGDLLPKPAGHLIGVAISGGSDSTALLLLAKNWAARTGARIAAATVDHGLRAESAAEAFTVAQFCTSADISHHGLKWSGWDGQGNLQAAARAARYNLLKNWATDQGIAHVLLGHTADDQAETVLMALARGSGVDGLAGMSKSAREGFYRPLLEVSRESLRDMLRAQKVGWIDDPSNADPKFARVKARQMGQTLATLGLTPDRLMQTAAHMQRAQASLRNASIDFAAAHVCAEGPDLLIKTTAIETISEDVPYRVMAAAIRWFNGGDYKPRFRALCEALVKGARGTPCTLGGVMILPESGCLRLTREVAATPPSTYMPPKAHTFLWDHRWRVSVADSVQIAVESDHKLTIAPLSEAISQVPDWRAYGRPRQSLMATPALFQGDRLIAAPAAGLENGWSVQIVADFASYLAGH